VPPIFDSAWHTGFSSSKIAISWPPAAIAKEIGQDKVTLILLDGAGHDIDPFLLRNRTIHYGGEFDTAENMDKVFAFLNKYMK
jgi:hypothetical protein